MLNRNNFSSTQFPNNQQNRDTQPTNLSASFQASSEYGGNEHIIIGEELPFTRILKELAFKAAVFKYRPHSEHDSNYMLSPNFPIISPNSFEGLLGTNTNDIPYDLRCPISLGIINDPIQVSSGKIYDRNSLIGYFYSLRKEEIDCPLTRKKIHISELNNPTDKQTKANLQIFVNKKIEEAKLNSQSTNKERDALKRARLSFFKKLSEDHATTKEVQSCSTNPRLKRVK